MNKTKTNLLIDAGILSAFLVVSQPRLTGTSLHEWLGLAFAGTLIVHLLLHWKWVVSVAASFFRKLFHSSRLKFIVDVLLFVAFTAVTLSGVMISRDILSFFSIQLARNPAWRMLHSTSANATLLLTGLHFALNWNWVVNAVKCYLVAPVISLFKVWKPQPASLRTDLTKE